MKVSGRLDLLEKPENHVIRTYKFCIGSSFLGITGPLTQRLVAALLEENLLNSKGEIEGLAAMANESNDSCGENNSSSANRTNNTPIASLLKNGIDVEIRLKKELIELGILDISDFPKEKDDEVLSEIKRVRTELESIAEYNLNELKQLRVAAQEEMKRLDIKRKLDLVDQEVNSDLIQFCHSNSRFVLKIFIFFFLVAG